ncbi:Os08g0470101 [Oryza sativa Japonica Group]|uniref:Os08g0470101 protein n=1 Tax=Oryza sativa subsp. japonica TaxID=39947 RepID=A0A0P0XH01_ORYSJ|nr:Os08g0470101 [Oryza sativa Japonica Group]
MNHSKRRKNEKTLDHDQQRRHHGHHEPLSSLPRPPHPPPPPEVSDREGGEGGAAREESRRRPPVEAGGEPEAEGGELAPAASGGRRGAGAGGRRAGAGRRWREEGIRSQSGLLSGDASEMREAKRCGGRGKGDDANIGVVGELSCGFVGLGHLHCGLGIFHQCLYPIKPHNYRCLHYRMNVFGPTF